LYNSIKLYVRKKIKILIPFRFSFFLLSTKNGLSWPNNDNMIGLVNCFNRPSLQPLNWPMIRGLVRQILVTKREFYHLTIMQAQKVCFPPPGYWDFTKCLSAILKKGTKRLLAGHRTNLSSPDMKKSQTHQVLSKMSISPSLNDRESKSESESLKVKSSRKASSRSTFSLDISRSGSNLQTPQSGRSSAPYSPSTVSPYVHSTPNRQGSHAHIQLDVLGADNLISACKRAAIGNNGVPPDRKPSLRISLYLPNSYSEAVPVELKRVFFRSLESSTSEFTLNPRWNKSINILLPTPKYLLSKTDTLSAAGSTSSGSCSELLSWWGKGVIKVEVVDTERFNTDIHLGEVQFLLSALTNATTVSPLQRQSQVSVETEGAFQVFGSYPLVKAPSSNRVSGTITLHVFLHTPIWEMVYQGQNTSISQCLELRSEQLTGVTTPIKQMHSKFSEEEEEDSLEFGPSWMNSPDKGKTTGHT
jgi:hypothetical protein